MRNYFGVVPQEVKIFNNSLLFNITLDHEVVYDEVSLFCQKWGFDQFFESLPEGLDTLLGEEGVKASGGQKQLIGLARAIFGEHEYLLLDEFTSSMDDSTKHFAINLVQKLSKSMGVLVVSHDQEIVAMSNLKFKIKDKQLVLV